jgi:hypothetical protein
MSYNYGFLCLLESCYTRSATLTNRQRSPFRSAGPPFTTTSNGQFLHMWSRTLRCARLRWECRWIWMQPSMLPFQRFALQRKNDLRTMT